MALFDVVVELAHDKPNAAWLLADARRAWDPYIEQKLSDIFWYDPTQTTFRHEIEVGLDCDVLAQHFDFPEDNRIELLQAGWLHDTGKLGVPIEILTKQDRLTESETHEMRKHTYLAKYYLKRTYSPVVFDAANGHHESGKYPYPRKNQRRKQDGLEISNRRINDRRAFYPIAEVTTRLVAAVDTYHALSRARPYKDALPPERVTLLFTEKFGSMQDVMRYLPILRTTH